MCVAVVGRRRARRKQATDPAPLHVIGLSVVPLRYRESDAIEPESERILPVAMIEAVHRLTVPVPARRAAVVAPVRPPVAAGVFAGAFVSTPVLAVTPVAITV